METEIAPIAEAETEMAPIAEAETEIAPIAEPSSDDLLEESALSNASSHETAEIIAEEPHGEGIVESVCAGRPDDILEESLRRFVGKTSSLKWRSTPLRETLESLIEDLSWIRALLE